MDNNRFYDLLCSLEWNAFDDDGAYCPSCHRYVGEKHAEDCDLSQMMRELEEEPNV